MKKHTDLIDVGDVVRKARPPEEQMALEAENAALKKAIKKYKTEHGHLETMVNRILAEVPRHKAVPVVFKPKPELTKKPCDVVMHLSDIHYGAVQPEDEIEGFGEFSPDIAKARLLNFASDVLDWVTVKRNGYNVPNLHILATGDYISGDIHEELRVTNAFPSPVQAVEVGALLGNLVMGLAPHFAKIFIHMVTDDNHGRMTKKIQAKQAGLNNFSYVVAKYMQMAVSAQNNVYINIISRPWESVECNGRRYLLTHGHRVMGWAGFPWYGVERLVSREALKRMNAAEIRKFHRVVMGHWHAPLTHPSYWIGGSVSGTDAYDHGQGRYATPAQITWMIHPVHGEFDRTEWTMRT